VHLDQRFIEVVGQRHAGVGIEDWVHAVIATSSASPRTLSACHFSGSAGLPIKEILAPQDFAFIYKLRSYIFGANRASCEMG
jgi:hypothetical protein